MKTANLRNKTRNSLGISPPVWVMIIYMIVVVIACNNEEASPDFSASDEQSAGFDTMDDFYFDDADDLTTDAFASSEEDTAGGRISTDDRLACAVVTRTGTDDHRILIVDFGEGCIGPRGNVRKGMIRAERTGLWNTPGTYWVITFIDYFVNDVGIEGTRTVTVVSVTDALVVHDITLTEGRITWPDGRVGTREATRRREHERDPNHLLDRLIIYGTAQGTLCNGRTYYIEIIEPLVYDRACSPEGVVIPVQGVKLIKHGDREITVDYGDGTCDNIVTLTNQNGRTVRYKVGK